MKNNQRTIRELISDVAIELNRLKYTELSIHTSYTIPWNRFLKYAGEHCESYFSEGLGERYLSEQHQYPQNYTGKLPDRVKRDVRCIRVLGDFQAHNVIFCSRKRVFKTFPERFQFMHSLIEEYIVIRDLKKSSITKIKGTLETFFRYIDANKVDSLNDITASHISGFIASKTGYANATVCREAVNLRCVLKFAYEKGITENDLSEYVPHIRRLSNQKLMSYWDKQTTEKLLNSIDRGNPKGKRDYAIMLIAARYGIRSGDIIKLKLSDIDWEKQCIEFTQSKTNEPICFPLFWDIFDSIKDYYQFGRPPTSCQNVFVKHCAPYNEFSGLTHLSRYFSFAGIDVTGKPHGLHSLRHTLASRLLEKNVPVTTIAEILGHTDIHTTTEYLHIDLHNLKQCALDPDEVTLYG